MKIRKALIGFLLVTACYLIVLVWIDARNEVFASVSELLTVLPVLAALSLFSWFIRFIRWHWLLRRAGHKTLLFQGFLAYLSGFAFTATPGKVGELVRIRYLGPMGVPATRVLAAFVYERAFDLLAVLMLASLFISRIDLFLVVLIFVLLFLGIILFMVLKPEFLNRLAVHLRSIRARRLSRMVGTLRDGLAGCRVWADPLDALVAGGLGLIAWFLTSLAFVFLLARLNIDLPTLTAVSIYPLSMLAGAASMLPGGMGSTEAAIVAILSFHGSSLGEATLAAIGIRLATLWLSVICGFSAVAVLESSHVKSS